MLNIEYVVVLPNMYIMVKQLSNAKPTKKRIKANCQKFVTNAVSTPAAKPTKFEPINAGMRPNLSAIQPNSRPPTMAPKKNID